MALLSSRLATLLFVISFAFIFLCLSYGFVSESISWTAFPDYTQKGSAFDYLFKLLDTEESLTLPPDVFIIANETSLAESKKANPVTERQNDQKTRGPETPMSPLSRRSFKKLPLWDFDDVYNQDAPPRQAICAQSLRNSQDESFNKSFLPNIRLYMHKDNVNMSEWNRLSHFNNPFGFMEYRYNAVMEAVKLIPKPKEPLLLPKPGSNGCVRCAVVGTAGILNGSGMGKEIDDHDYVFRMNGAIIKGHEKDVGNRTSVYVHTSHSMAMSLYLFKKYGYTSAPHDEGIKFVMIPEGMRDFSWLIALLKKERVKADSYRGTRPLQYYGSNFNVSRFYVLHPDFLRYVRNRFLKSRNLGASYWAIVRPTNGAFALFTALHTCDIVSAYGFMTDDYNKYNNYYFENNVKTHVVFYANHDYILEKNMWKKLHETKILRLYQRTNPKTVTEKQKKP